MGFVVGGNSSGASGSASNALIATGRLSPESGVYEPDGATVYTAISTLYLVPENNTGAMKMPMWDGSQFRQYNGEELSLDISGAIASTLYTVTLNYDPENPSLAMVPWKTTIVNGASVEPNLPADSKFVDGIRLLNDQVVIGTFYVGSTAGQTRLNDNNAFWISNTFNRKKRGFQFTDNTSHSYGGNWRTYRSQPTANISLCTAEDTLLTASGYAACMNRGQVRVNIENTKHVGAVIIQSESSDGTANAQKPSVSGSGIIPRGINNTLFEQKGDQSTTSTFNFGFCYGAFEY